MTPTGSAENISGVEGGITDNNTPSLVLLFFFFSQQQPCLLFEIQWERVKIETRPRPDKGKYSTLVVLLSPDSRFEKRRTTI